ncbi:VRR-NUC domain-containing protein [Acinetobacter gyllenbergii]|uniref:VRR-NUC domain-containing protein n=1 Tax=Acinetobacter gyllenbergii TaxID=134534 RepID=UPI00241D4FCC|nr:VRR-NUC domain-containing protein [Acinetobacter gyllenbergii]
MAKGGKPLGTLTTTQLEPIKVIALDQGALTPQDKEVLCKVICYCGLRPNKGKTGQNLHQSCVSERLRELDKFMRHQSPYKPEVTYDMTTSPPEPIMSKRLLTKVHEYVPAWIRKYWEKEKGYPYEKGQNLTKRPDVIIVKDLSKPPTQENIKNVVEIKFGNDVYGRDQEKSYTEIAGDANKVKVLTPEECDCGNLEESTVTELSTAAAWAAGIAGALLYVISRGKTPAPRFPVPVW